jgi:phosphoribosyl 1,2-cyclic phosphodiesterase/CheY-like chemotaxis protein
MRKLVVVDDDADIRRVAEKRLKAAGYEVYTAEDGLAGLQLIRTLQPAVAIVDLMMPKMHGFQLCQEIRQDPALADVKIIVCSAKAYAVDRQKALEVGANAYLLKPYNLEELVARVQEVAATVAPALVVKFWGTRGSIPTPGPGTARYGGNTSCVEVRCGDHILMFDCGSGAREMGLALAQEFKGKPLELNLLVTHTHWDHIQGFPFFVPAYTPGAKINIYSLRGSDKSLERVFTGQMDASYFPVALGDMMAHLNFVELDGVLKVGEASVTHLYLNHPGLAVGFRVEAGGQSMVYLTDHEPYTKLSGDNEHNRKLEAEIADFIRGTDLYIREAQYTEEEYPSKKGWGHSTWRDALESAAAGQVKRLALFHHDPMHDDECIDGIVRQCHAYMQEHGMSFECFAAADNQVLRLGAQRSAASGVSR